MFIFNIALLAIGPIAVLALLLLAIFTAQKRRAAEGKAQPGAQSGGIKGLILALLGWVRFWVALAIAVLVNVVVFSAFVKLNPFVRLRFSGFSLLRVKSFPLSGRPLPFLPHPCRRTMHILSFSRSAVAPDAP